MLKCCCYTDRKAANHHFWLIDNLKQLVGYKYYNTQFKVLEQACRMCLIAGESALLTPMPTTKSLRLTFTLLLFLHLGLWHPPPSLLCSPSPFDSAPPPLLWLITPLHIKIFVFWPLAFYHFLPPPPNQGSFATCVTGSPFSQEVTQEVC